MNEIHQELESISSVFKYSGDLKYGFGMVKKGWFTNSRAFKWHLKLGSPII